MWVGGNKTNYREVVDIRLFRSWRYRPIKARAMSGKYVGMRERMAYKYIGWLKIGRFQNNSALLPLPEWLRITGRHNRQIAVV